MFAHFLLAALLTSRRALAQSSTTSTVSVLQESVTAAPSQTLLPFETLQLTDNALDGLNETELELFAFADSNITESSAARARSAAACKVFPGDSSWPFEVVWKLFGLVTGGALLHPLPKARVCWGATYDEAACAAITADWTNSYSHLDDPIEMFNPEFQGMTCQPPAFQYPYITTCTQGGYPVYTIKAKNVAQIQLAINFARATGIRLVVKNTGHDFMGKSSGAGSLSIWTHYLKDKLFIPTYKDASGYTGPVIKLGAGVQAYEAYAFAHANKVLVVGGEGQTVGLAGGYIAGGGHSPLSSIHGMAADHVLAFEVVTADGRFRRASSTENTDLFWALRGGGGGTFGVVTSVTIKAYPDIPVTTASFTFVQVGPVTPDIFWAGVRAFVSRFPEFAAAGTYSYFFLYPAFVTGVGTMFVMQPFFFPKMSLAESQALLAPMLSELAALGIEITPTWNTYTNFYDAWQAAFPRESIMNAHAITASRLIPSSNWASNASIDATTALLRDFIDARGHLLFAFHMSPTLSPSNAPNAVNPAWRTSLSHVIFANSWGNATRAEAKASWDEFSTVQMQKWRDLTPGGGSYLNECDRQEPHWQEAFYGSAYERLVVVKKTYDPTGLFWVATGVGSEGWSVRSVDGMSDENGRLCRV